MCPNLIVGLGVWATNQAVSLYHGSVSLVLTVDLGNWLSGSAAGYASRVAVAAMGAPAGLEGAGWKQLSMTGAHRLAPFTGMQFMLFDALRSLRDTKSHYKRGPHPVSRSRTDPKAGSIAAAFGAGFWATFLSSAVCNPFWAARSILAEKPELKGSLVRGLSQAARGGPFNFYNSSNSPPILKSSVQWGVAFAVEEFLATHVAGASRLGSRDDGKWYEPAVHAGAGGVATCVGFSATHLIGLSGSSCKITPALLSPMLWPASMAAMPRVGVFGALAFGGYEALSKLVVRPTTNKAVESIGSLQSTR